MLPIKDKINLLKLKKLAKKRDEAFRNGKFQEAKYYGDLVDHYITNVLKLEDGVF